MPLVKINLRRGRPVAEKHAIGAAVQAALVECLGIPDEDRYQLYIEHEDENFRHTGGYLGLTYTDALLILEITFVEGRGDPVKKALLAAINRNLTEAGLARADDVFVMITEVGRANVSFGGGIAQRAL